MRKHRKRYAGYTGAVLAALVIIAVLLQAVSMYGGGENKEGGSKTESELEYAGADKEKGDLKAGEKSDEKPNVGKTQKKDASVENKNIRVLLLTTGYGSAVHESVELSSEGGLQVSYGDEQETYPAEKTFSLNGSDKRFEKGNVKIQSAEKDGEVKIHTIERGYGAPVCGGTIELRAEGNGVVIINELPLETYLCRVVPSEMPSGYELEALKAQAVCARSYACRQMEEYAYPEYKAHVNDSTDYQVYNNSPAAESSTKAVEETKGQAVYYKDNVATTYYYSTSCGRTTSAEAWGSKPTGKNGYLKSVKVQGEDGDYEKDLPWYKWTARIPADTLSSLISAYAGKDLGALESVEVTKRGPGEVALELKATGSAGTVSVKTENKIRTALGGTGYSITQNDGTVIDSTALLPSAFFTIEKGKGEFIIEGGGFGHGIGMSQNGANEMAKQGEDYKEILELFYQGVEIK